MPFYFEPYTQSIKWVRPESGSDFHGYARGERFFRGLEFITCTIENVETIEYSVIDFIQDLEYYGFFPSFEYDSDFEVKQEDPYWNFSLMSGLGLDNLNNKLNEEWFDWVELF